MINQLSFDFRSIRRVTEKKVFGVNDEGRKEGEIKFLLSNSWKKTTRINKGTLDYFVINIACKSYVGSFHRS